MNRLSSLDYLRGLAAFGIMAFHYSMWTYGFAKGGDFIGKIGIYAVPVFYVISGLTLYHVYFNKIGGPSKKGLVDFAIKRIFRIFPLFWLMSIATLLIEKITMPLSTILWALSGLFSVYHWENHICYGGWSIGNELVFYLFFPVFIFLSKRSKLSFFIFSLLILLAYLWFAFIRFDSSKSIVDFWLEYMNPLNQVFLFLGGYLIGYLFSGMHIAKATGIAIAVTSFLVFIVYPVKDDSIYLITGINRMAFTLIVFALCFAFYKTEFGLPSLLHRIFGTLGEISYSVYLVHPIIWYVLTHLLPHSFSALPPLARVLIAISASLLTSYLVYDFYEKYFMRLGAKLSKKVAT